MMSLAAVENVPALTFSALDSALEEMHEEVRLDELASDLPLHDERTPYRRERVVAYAGAPGSNGFCPQCGMYGVRVDGWGKITCDNCGYINTEERRLARQVPRRNWRRY